MTKFNYMVCSFVFIFTLSNDVFGMKKAKTLEEELAENDAERERDDREIAESMERARLMHLEYQQRSRQDAEQTKATFASLRELGNSTTLSKEQELKHQKEVDELNELLQQVKNNNPTQTVTQNTYGKRTISKANSDMLNKLIGPALLLFFAWGCKLYSDYQRAQENKKAENNRNKKV